MCGGLKRAASAASEVSKVLSRRMFKEMLIKSTFP